MYENLSFDRRDYQLDSDRSLTGIRRAASAKAYRYAYPLG